MYVVKVIPITRGAFKERLSFFSKTKLEPGTVVDAPIRGKATPALVVGANDAREEKFELRDSAYALKKIVPKVSARIFPTTTLEALRESASYHALSVGAVLAYFMPSAITTALERVADVPTTPERNETASDKLVLQAELDERIRMYRNIAREAFARSESVVLVAPTLIEAETLYEKLHRGIEEQVVLFTSAITKKGILTAWNRVVSDPEGLLIICTPSFLMVPRPNVNAYIFERESARSYRARERPHIDARLSAEFLAARQGSRIIYADFPIRIETRARLHSGELEELMRLQVSSQRRTTVSIVDARKKENEGMPPPTKKKFSVFTDTALGAIRAELERRGRVFVYAQRKGLAPLTVCNDCGTPVTDPTSETPMTLHKTEKGNVFMSYRSGAVMPANSSCSHCGSWNLVSLGIGVERVKEELENLCTQAPLFSLTTDTAPTHAKAKKIQKQFFETAGAILVGTERALPYLTEPVELSVVTSIDSLLSIPAWRAHEYALGMLFYLRDHTHGALFVQTRQSESEVMHAVATGNPTEFIRNEMKEREQFGYPPFATFVGLTWSGTEKTVDRISTEVSAVLKPWDVVGPLPARHVGKNRYLARAVIRMKKGHWPEENLRTALRSLPPEVAVAVDPDEIV